MILKVNLAKVEVRMIECEVVFFAFMPIKGNKNKQKMAMAFVLISDRIQKIHRLEQGNETAL